MANPVTKISAIFKGEEGSLGFTQGESYELSLMHYCNGAIKITHNRPGTIIGYQPVEYSNLRAFLQNWRDINLGR